MDASYQILVLARRISGMGGTHMLKKVMFLFEPQKKKRKKISCTIIYMCLSFITFPDLVCIIGLRFLLPQVNLINPLENEDIQLPPGTKAIKDLRISPCGRLTLLASLGKKLSILRFAYFILLANVIL